MLGQNLIIRGLVGNRLVGGTWTASGTWTIPAVTLGGAVLANQNETFGRNVDNAALIIRGGTLDGINSLIGLFGKSHATTPGKFLVSTTNNALSSTIDRLAISGAIDIAVVTWTNCYNVFATSIDSAAVADQVSVGGYEISAGHRALAISSEEVVVADADETKFSHKLPVRINGATYNLMLCAT